MRTRPHRSTSRSRFPPTPAHPQLSAQRAASPSDGPSPGSYPAARPSPRSVAQLVSGGILIDAPSKLFGLPFTAFDVACCMGKESVCKLLLEAQPAGDWWECSLDLATSRVSEIAEYVRDQEKHKNCVQLLRRRKVLAGLHSELYKSVEQGDEKRVLAILEQGLVRISDKETPSDHVRSEELMTLAMKNYDVQMLTLLQAFAKVNTPVHLQHALVQLGELYGDTTETTLLKTALAAPFVMKVQSLLVAGVVLREPELQNDKAYHVYFERLLSDLCVGGSINNAIFVELLLGARVDPNVGQIRVGRTPLLQACLSTETATVKTVKLLLDAKASADTPAVPVFFGPSGTIMATPLSATILRCDSAVTKLVLDALRWRVNKTELAALVSMTPLVRKHDLVRTPADSALDKCLYHLCARACAVWADQHRGLRVVHQAPAQAERISRALQNTSSDDRDARAA